MKLQKKDLILSLISHYTRVITDVKVMTEFDKIIEYLYINDTRFGVCRVIAAKFAGSPTKWIKKYNIGAWWGVVPFDCIHMSHLTSDCKIKCIIGTLELRLENLKKELDCIKK